MRRDVRAQALSAIGILALAAAVLTGCNDDVRPDIGPTPVAHTATASSGSDAGGTSIGTGEAPERTEGLPPHNAALNKPDDKAHEARWFDTDEGAHATARYAIEALYYGYATGDKEPFESVVSVGACEACGETLAEIDRWRESKKFSSVVRVTPGNNRTSTTKDGYVSVRYQYAIDDAHPGSYGDGADDQPKEQHTVHMTMDFSDGKWLILHVKWID